MYGSAAVAGASLLGIGALCYYGLGLSKQGQSIMVQSGFVFFKWIEYLFSTYLLGLFHGKMYLLYLYELKLVFILSYAKRKIILKKYMQKLFNWKLIISVNFR